MVSGSIDTPECIYTGRIINYVLMSEVIVLHRNYKSYWSDISIVVFFSAVAVGGIEFRIATALNPRSANMRPQNASAVCCAVIA